MKINSGSGGRIGYLYESEADRADGLDRARTACISRKQSGVPDLTVRVNPDVRDCTAV